MELGKEKKKSTLAEWWLWPNQQKNILKGVEPKQTNEGTHSKLNEKIQGIKDIYLRSRSENSSDPHI